MLRVAEQYAGTDTGRQRRANEDSLLTRSPLFVVADGMGGAQAGEVASRIAVESFKHGLDDTSEPELALSTLASEANSRIHELSHSNAEQAGMGTTLTAVYVGAQEVAIAHVGDSRAYCLRDGELLRLTDDHSLVDELVRQGRLTPEEAIEHPQRSELAGVLLAHPKLSDAGEALIAAANQAGGRDNITVVLLRLEEVDAAGGSVVAEEPDTGTHRAVDAGPEDWAGRPATMTAAPAVSAPVSPRTPRRAAAGAGGSSPRRRARLRRVVALVAALVVLGLIGSGVYLGLQSIYFIGTNNRGLVTVFRGLPYRLPGNLNLYSSTFVSGVSASTVTPERRRTLLDHSLRSEANAAALIRSLELGQLE